MYQALLRDPRFFQFLSACDDELAEEARQEGCPRCGGRLHRADYPRKPRGGPQEMDSEMVIRRSFCCARCRRRQTPGSVLFLGRRVYFGIVVILIETMRRGVSPARLTSLQEHVGISARTLRRWRRWWQTTFAQSGFWRLIQGRLRHPIAASDLPLALLDCFSGNARARLIALLRLLLPISVGSPDPGLVL